MTKLIVGNWKMFLNPAQARELGRAVAQTPAPQGVERVVCPSFIHLHTVREALMGSDVALGAQNCADRGESALTGEVAASMLADCGCTYVILGHSERREHLGEDNHLLGRKLQQTVETSLTPIFCVGETLAQREGGDTNSVLHGQLSVLEGYMGGDLVIAYEPVWAIGTGKVAGAEDIVAAHAFIAETVRALLGASVALRVLYGGSVKPDNAASILHLSGVDGALVGGASLKADSFAGITVAAGE